MSLSVALRRYPQVMVVVCFWVAVMMWSFHDCDTIQDCPTTVCPTCSTCDRDKEPSQVLPPSRDFLAAGFEKTAKWTLMVEAARETHLLRRRMMLPNTAQMKKVKRSDDNPVVVVGNVDPWLLGRGSVSEEVCGVACEYDFVESIESAIEKLEAREIVHLTTLPWLFTWDWDKLIDMVTYAESRGLQTMFSTGEISFDPRPMFIADLFQSPYPASDAIFYYDNTMIHCKEDPDGPTRLSSMDLPTPDPTDKVNAAVVVVSNCGESATWRSAYIVELMRHMKVYSLGGCWHTADAPIKPDSGGFYKDKQIAAEQYRFFISMENSLVTNYFTEKFLEALDYDTVVVYGGPPDAKAHFPSPNSFVDILDFPDPADLAAFLNAMTDDEWRSRFEWRKKASVQPKLAELARKRGCLSRPKWTACAMCRAYHDVFDYEPTVG